MQKRQKVFLKFFKAIPSLALFLILFNTSQIHADVFSAPTLSRPSAPGKFGSRSLDWSASDNGEVSYQIPLQTPNLRQLDIGLSLKYSATDAYGEAGSFWGFNLSKVTLDLKRGNTKFISSASCFNSKAENLYLNGARLIPIGNGIWASKLNSGRDLLHCQQNGFIYYKSTGEIFYYGSNNESQVADNSGNAIEWYLTKKSTRQGSQEINYIYTKPFLSSDLLGFDQQNKFNFNSKPLLASIQADDVSVNIEYEENTFKNPHFFGGFPQIIFGRAKNISILKKQSLIRSYFINYEDSNKTSFPRLSSVQEFGSDGTTALPKTIFSYRGANSSLAESFNSVNETYDYSLSPLKRSTAKFADVLGIGQTQIIRQIGYNSLWLYTYDPSHLFSSDNGGLKNTKKQEIKFEGHTHSWATKTIKNVSFIDLLGNGVMDLYTSNGPNELGPVIVLNDRKIDSNGDLILERFATFNSDNLNFMRRCDRDPRTWKPLNLRGTGKTDFICINAGHVYALINNGMIEKDKERKRYEINFEQIKIPMDSFLRRSKNEDIAVVDWNADGLPDLLHFLGNKITVNINNGRLAKGERNVEFFEKSELGLFPDLNYVKATKVTIGDFTGTGFPSIHYKQKRFLINNGLGKPLTESFIKNAVHFSPEHAAVVQFTGTGKQQIIASTLADNGNIIFELANRSFPNHLHSIVTSDGRFLSFNYSSTVLENNEAITLDGDEEIKKLEQRSPLMPIVVPVLKQVGLSDGLNPTRMWRYAYRLPSFDRSLNKFLGFSLVRKQTVGDKTQSGTLNEQRFLSGYRLSESEISAGADDFRLNSELNTFSQGAPTECVNPNLTTEATLWCSDLSGYSYYNKSGAAFDGLSFATGKINTVENRTKSNNKISIKFFENNNFLGVGNLIYSKNEVAQILVDSEETQISGDTYLNYQTLYGKVTNIYDEQGRISTKIKSNSPVLNGDDLITNFTYFCPQSHQENPKTFCDNYELIQAYSSIGSVKQTSKKINYNSSTGLAIEEWSSNQNGELTLQTTAKYDKYGRIIKLNKLTGESSQFEWEEDNSNLNSIIDQDNVRTNAQYNNIGQIIKIDNSRGSISQFSYDTIGRVLNISKNLGGNATLSITHIAQNTWDIFIDWLKRAFGIGSTTNFKTNNDNIFNSITNNKLFEFEKYEYVFPSVKLNNGNSLEEAILSWNQFDKYLPIFPNANSYNESILGQFIDAKIEPGSVTTYRRNQEKENLTLVSKIWLSGADEVLFSATRLDNDRFSITNKSNINSLGKVHKEYLNAEINLQDIIANKLPNKSTFQVKNIYSFYYNGNVATEEFDSGIIQKMIQGVDFDEAISPEGRRARNIYNQLGQISERQIGLDINGNPSQETLSTKINYDTFGRLIKVTNNDGLEALQTFASNGEVEEQNNNALGISRYFYDNYGRVLQSAICPVGTDPQNCNLLTSSVLYKTYSFNEKGRLNKEEHTRFNRENGTNAKETIQYVFGSSERNDRQQDIGLPVSISVSSLNELTFSESVRKLAYNKEGNASSEELELFIGTPQSKKSLGVYQIERLTDLSANLIQLRSRGGFNRDTLNKLKTNHFTGYAASYENGTSNLKQLSFLQNGIAQSVPLQKLNLDSQGFTKKITLENNLELHACWHKRKEVPLAYWAGNSNSSPNEICEDTALQNKGLFHSRWEYDKDLFPISATDLSENNLLNPVLSGNSLFTYDSQGRLASTRGVADEKTSWGSIHYNYSAGGKINKVTRSGNFIKERIHKNSNSIIDSYLYSNTGQIGLLQSVNSTDGHDSAIQSFASDSIGFRKFGVAPTLAVFSSASWKNQSEIPMQKYIWNGRGQLAGVFSASKQADSKEILANSLLNYRMNDESGGQIAEFDGVEFHQLLNETASPKNNLSVNKLPRSVSVSQGITFERDEIHFNIDIGPFATLRLITRYPTLNAQNPESLSSSSMQTRKELVIKDHVGSVSQIIDITSHKVVERNASEPFGLARGIPLLSNSNLDNYKSEGKRRDVSLYTNEQSNMRSNWEIKSYEIIGTSNENEAQGMRGTSVFAKGKFSASTGLSNMGVRTLDPSRGVWMSPDIYVAQRLETVFQSPAELNLFQYSKNNPIQFNDESGKIVPFAVWGLGVAAVRVGVIAAPYAARYGNNMAAAAAVAIKGISDVLQSNNAAITNKQEQTQAGTKAAAIAPTQQDCNPNTGKSENSKKFQKNREKGKSAENQIMEKYEKMYGKGSVVKNYKLCVTPSGATIPTIPDFYVDRGANQKGLLIEVKNTTKQGYTKQIQYEQKCAELNGMDFILEVNKNTKISSKLKDAESAGFVQINNKNNFNDEDDDNKSKNTCSQQTNSKKEGKDTNLGNLNNKNDD